MRVITTDEAADAVFTKRAVIITTFSPMEARCLREHILPELDTILTPVEEARTIRKIGQLTGIYSKDLFAQIVTLIDGISYQQALQLVTDRGFAVRKPKNDN
jgi:hypothetical protein